MVKRNARLLSYGTIRWVPVGQRTDTKELLSTCGLLDQGISFQYLNTQAFIDLRELFSALPIGAQELACRSVVIAVERFGHEASRPIIAHLKQIASWVSEHGGDVSGSYRKLVLALIEDKNLNLGIFNSTNLREELWARFERLGLDQKLRLFFSTPTANEQQSLSLYLLKEGKPNSPPFLNSPAYEDKRNEVRRNARSIAARSWRHTFNFQRLSGERQRSSPGAEAVLATFGRDIFEDFRAIHASSRERAPGQGYFLSGPQLEKLFPGWPESEEGYSSGYSAFGRSLCEFPDASFCFLTNAIIAHHPSHVYQLPVGASSGTSLVPYALYLESDYSSGGYDLAALVPWRMLSERIAPCLLDPKRPALACDVSDPGFNLLSLSKEGERQGTPVVMLANISTIFGGSVAGYPKGSAPFFTWERGTEQVDPWHFDGLGRLHYAWYLEAETGRRSFGEATSSSAQKPVTEQRIELLAPLGEGCFQVATAAKGLLDLLDLFYALYDTWKCSLTPHNKAVPEMVTAIHTWHTSLRQRNAPQSEYPVLCIADRYNWNSLPVPILDTFTMIPNRQNSGICSIASLVEWWKRSVIPAVTRPTKEGSLEETGKTLLLLSREYVS